MGGDGGKWCRSRGGVDYRGYLRVYIFFYRCISGLRFIFIFEVCRVYSGGEEVKVESVLCGV